MATTHKQSPQAIARQVLKSNPPALDRTGLVCLKLEDVQSLIMLGIAAYTDASNQRPENLSEACARLGINLHWSQVGIGPREYRLFFGMQQTPLSVHTHEEPLILEIEMLHEAYPEVRIWVEAML